MTTVLIAGALVLGTWCLVAGVAAWGRTRRSSAAGSVRLDRATSSARPRSGGLVVSLVSGLQRRARVRAPEGVRHSLQRRLERAGLQGTLDADALVVAQILAAVAGGLGAVVYARAGLPAPVSGPMLIALSVAAGAALPFVGVARLAQRRERLIVTQLPDLLDLMALSVSAGLAFDVALLEVTSQIRGPLAEELDLVTTSIALGTSRSDALEWLDQRLQIPALSSFVLAVNQAAELGSPIGVTLQTQAEVGRVRRRQLEEERIQKLPVKILLPTVLFILPPTILVVLGPAIVDIMEAL